MWTSFHIGKEEDHSGHVKWREQGRECKQIKIKDVIPPEILIVLNNAQ